MRANILLIEFEQRSVDRVRQALAQTEHQLEIAGDLHRAVEICAHFEPRLVIITGELPNLSVEDAITQLRARAGLRVTPFLILQSGYEGSDSEAEAAQLGAQDILGRPFVTEDLIERVERLVRVDSTGPAAQAIPQETLDALRRSDQGGAPSLTSDDLFGDILSDVESDGAAPPEPPPSPDEPAPDRPRPPRGGDRDLDEALAEALGMSGPRKPSPRKPSPPERDVDAMLSETLAGLDVQLVASKAAGRPRQAAPESEPSPPVMEPPPTAAGEPPSPPEPMPDLETPAEPEPSQPPTAAAEPDRTRFGQYILEQRVAKGGMAEVYRARMMGVEGFQKTVAIKRILADMVGDEEFVTMFIDEAKLAAQLKHPNIVDIYDLGKIDRSFYIAMEYVEGHDLRQVLGACRAAGVTFPVPLALFVAAQLAAALDHAHTTRDFEDRDLGLVHRDVSPPNVLISGDGEVKLCDFGIAKALTKASQTRDGLLKGKLKYMSPEQASGRAIDHRSDLFSLGLVLFEMLTGERVFDGASEAEILAKVRDPEVSAPSSLNPDVPPDVDRIVLRCLEADPASRYQSAEAVGRAIDNAIRGHGWSPDTAMLAAFARDPSTPVDVAVAVPATAVPPPPPEVPAEPPAADEPFPEAEPPEPSEPALELEPELSGPSPFLEPEVEKKRPWWLAAVAVGVIVIAAVLYGVLGRDGGGRSAEPTPAPVVAVPPTATSTPTPDETDPVVMPPPTATPRPPTATPTDTETPTPTETETPTPVPPTATPTRIPPTATPGQPTPTFTPAVVEGELVSAGPGVTRPVLVHQVSPDYPRMAQRLEADGEVEVEILVGPDGAVEDVRIISVSRPGVGFESATEEAVRQWRYKPATKNDVNVRMWVTARVRLSYR